MSTLKEEWNKDFNRFHYVRCNDNEKEWMDLADWFISHFRDMIENKRKENAPESIPLTSNLQDAVIWSGNAGYNVALSDLLAELEK